MHIAFATSRETVHLTDQDRLLAQSFRKQGVQVTAAIWSEATVNWQDFQAIIIRSCWDYHKQVEQFLQWIEVIERLNIPLYNQASIIQWNYHKGYLKEMAERGIPIIPTRWFDAKDRPRLSAVMEDLDAQEIVIKPAVGATAYKTHKLDSESVNHFSWEEQGPYPQGFLVQKFLHQVQEQGEWSHIFFGGNYSHSVLKKAKLGEFRVQSNFGGKSEVQTAEPRLVQQAHVILDLLDPLPLYARIDGLHIEDTFHLMELELIEPELYLKNEELASNFVKAFLDYPS